MKSRKVANSLFFNVGSNVLSQLITVAFIPLVARLYSPESFGQVSLFLGLCSCLVAISSFRLAVVIPIAETKQEKQIALESSLLAVLFFSLLLSILFVVTDILDAIGLGDLYYLVLLYFFFASINNVQVNLIISDGSYSVIGKSKLINSMLLNCTRLLLAYSFLSYGLIYSLVFAEFITLIFLLNITTKKFREFGYIKGKKRADFFAFLSKYSSFPKYQLISQLVLISSQYAPIFVLSTTFNAYEVGLFAMANNLVNLPVNSVGMAISQIYYGEYRKKKYWNKMFKHSLLIIIAFILAAIPAIFIMVLFGNEIVDAILGENWSGVGEIVILLIFMGTAKLCLAVISQSLNIFRAQKLQLLINILFFTVSYLSLYIAIKTTSEFLDVLFIYTVSCTVMLFICIFMALLNIKVNTKNECNFLR